MWPNLIVVSAPILHLFAGIRKGQEPMLVQTFGAEAAVECFDEGIVRRLSWVRRMISKRTTRVFDIRASRLNPEKGWDSTLRRSRARSDLVLRETCAARPCRCRGDAGPGADGEHSGHAQIFIAGQLSAVRFVGQRQSSAGVSAQLQSRQLTR
ncbi:hypothetical protein BA011_35220 (plasmid) [Rhizobium leguminosarum]|uniref:Uncharacterized protein n=1 Tax=Rhizobium leguminosarum TaxID=384 RepID=A0A1B1CN69_RHILE|nr:hypothetical protein BA011_35220 [Rhizobium leguminosarum]